MVEELERRRIVAAIIAEEAARKKQAALLKEFQQLHHYLIINNKGTGYELFRATIAELHTNYAERASGTNRRVDATTANTIRMLRDKYETPDAGVPRGKTNSAKQADRDQQLYHGRIQQLSPITAAALNRVRYSLWFSRVIADEVDQPSEILGAITKRCRAFTDGINRIIVRLVEDGILKYKLKDRFAKKMKAKKRVNQQELTVEKLVNQINGVKLPVNPEIDLKNK